MKKYISLVILFLIFSSAKSNFIPPTINACYPSNWWVGMQTNEIEILFYGNFINYLQPSTDYEGVSIVSTQKTKNPNYLFVTVKIAATANPGTIWFTFKHNKIITRFPFELKKRSGYKPQGLTTQDLIYLIMPDRFCNGDTSNDIIADYNYKYINRKSDTSRHGGDLQGIYQNLDYIKNLGTTALWLNPVMENNQPYESYHGYAITNHYKIDARLGTLDIYKKLVEKCHEQKMKMVFDVVLNHVGNNCFLYADMPDSSWFHWWPTFTRTTYKDGVLFDPYAANIDKLQMSNGWFDYHMPDLNQQNNKVAKYLIQQQLWWIETAGIDALRLDTWAYPDLQFEKNWVAAIQNEYPSISIFGETWVHGAANQSFFVQNNIANSFNSNLPGVTDFQLYYAINDALTEPFGWTEGVNKLYHTLCADYLYKNANNNIVFLDNHDLSRYWSMCKEDLKLYKIGIAFLLTTRGIPMLYTGTEILMKNYANLAASNVRADFPGGWKNDSINKFKLEGKTILEKQAYNYLAKIANWRKNNDLFVDAKLMQFVPEKGVYVYFRYNTSKQIMVIINTNEATETIDLKRFSERIGNTNSGIDITTNAIINLNNSLKIEPKTAMIIEMK